MTGELIIFWDANDPLKAVENEPSTANRALRDYAHMGYSRSLRRLHDKYLQEETPPTDSYGTIASWSSSFDWQDRVAAYDNLEREREEKVWRERRDELRNKEWKNFYRLQEIISELLEEVPKFIKRREKIVDKGTPTIMDSNGILVKKGEPEKKVIILSIDAPSIIRFIRTASDIGRRAAEMDQSYMAKLINEINFEKLTPEQIARIAEGEHILDVLGIRK